MEENKQLDLRMAEMEIMVRSIVATKEWVREEIKPVKEIAMRTEGSISHLSSSVDKLAQELTANARSQDAVWRQRAQQEAQEHLENERRKDEEHREKLRLMQEEKNKEAQDREERHRKELEDANGKTLVSVVKNKWQPMLAFVAVILTILWQIVEHVSFATGSVVLK